MIGSGRFRWKGHHQRGVEEIYEKKVTPYGNGAKIDSQKNTSDTKQSW